MESGAEVRTDARVAANASLLEIPTMIDIGVYEKYAKLDDCLTTNCCACSAIIFYFRL